MLDKIRIFQLTEYLHSLIPNDHHHYNTGNPDFVETYYDRTDVFVYSFFSFMISEWNNFDSELQNAKS